METTQLDAKLWHGKNSRPRIEGSRPIHRDSIRAQGEP